MPPIPVPRAAVMPVPIRRGAMAARLFLWESFPWGRLLILPLLLWGMLDPGSGRPRCNVQGSQGGDMNMHRSHREWKFPGWCNYLCCFREPKWKHIYIYVLRNLYHAQNSSTCHNPFSHFLYSSLYLSIHRTVIYKPYLLFLLIKCNSISYTFFTENTHLTFFQKIWTVV